MTVIILVIAVILVYLFMLMGRTGHPGLAQLRGWNYAHRGLHSDNVPENSMAAFRAAMDGGYGIEFDLHLLADGNLGVMHDSSLKRTVGADITMEELKTEDLQKYHLGGTDQTIPEFRQILELFDGKAPLIVELKSAGDNYAALTETACKMLDGYKGLFCIESFDPRCVKWLKDHRPDIIRGQLSENFLRSKVSAKLPLRFAMTYYLSNCINRPDFIAYNFADRKNLSVYLCRKLGIQPVAWTIRSQQEFDEAKKEGWIPIFEKFIPQ